MGCSGPLRWQRVQKRQSWGGGQTIQDWPRYFQTQSLYVSFRCGSYRSEECFTVTSVSVCSRKVDASSALKNRLCLRRVKWFVCILSCTPQLTFNTPNTNVLWTGHRLTGYLNKTGIHIKWYPNCKLHIVFYSLNSFQSQRIRDKKQKQTDPYRLVLVSVIYGGF